MAKRRRRSLPTDLCASKLDHMDQILDSFLALSDSSTLSLDLSFDRLLQSRTCDSDQNDMIQRTSKLGSFQSVLRIDRNCASLHIAVVWALPSDITVKGFKKLKYVDFSTSFSFTGAFLRNLGDAQAGNLQEVLILRNHLHLKEVKITTLSFSLSLNYVMCRWKLHVFFRQFLQEIVSYLDMLTYQTGKVWHLKFTRIIDVTAQV
ncbi:uncharacterized protein LOC130790990 isoform X1 [Actinidia eriantha]|uniref:uncharacterized protein LOC130790990 isoform X1 n=1 Tax=Actinidia eriantha TaxID=165200 RepID=UPI00258D2C88|nr:uncharacterized protein LOC130790990 isoform X1 [Actinidia eriantha]